MNHSWVKRSFSFFFSQVNLTIIVFLFLFAVTVTLWRQDRLRRDNCGKGWEVSGEKWGKGCFFFCLFIYFYYYYFNYFFIIILFVSFFIVGLLHERCLKKYHTSNLTQTRKSSMSCYIVLKLRSYHIYVCLDYLTPTVGLLIEYFFKY